MKEYLVEDKFSDETSWRYFVERNDPIPYVFYFLFIFVWYMISLVSDHYK